MPWHAGRREKAAELAGSAVFFCHFVSIGFKIGPFQSEPPGLFARISLRRCRGELKQ